MRCSVVVAVAVAFLGANARSGRCGDDDTLDASEDELKRPPADEPKWNEYDLHYLTLRVGGGMLIDYANYEQNAESKEQMDLPSGIKLRDARILLKGRLTFAPRVSYALGYMYYAPNNKWRFSQTGVMFDVPELAGSVFIGRTKEGFSTSKLMVGYFGWTLERSAANDAFLPILADGIKWTGRITPKIVYNAGWFIDTLSENESFNRNDRQFATRVVVLPLADTDSTTVVHVAGEYRYGASDDGFLQFKSKPESFLADSFAVDTGKFAATAANTVGAELYIRPGPFMFGSEYYINKITSASTGNPVFNGGEAFVSYMFTGEVRPYDDKGAFFEGVKPVSSVFEHGHGAWEGVVRFSYVDLDSRAITGGKFWRITPVISWYLSSAVRLVGEYGYSRLDRFGIIGATQYLQWRVQLMF